MNEIILRDYQYEAFKNIIFENKGRCVMPTGAGKTFEEAVILGYKIINSDDDISIVLSPRIILIQQLIREYRHVLTKGTVIKTENGNKLFTIDREVRMFAFHSGEHEPEYTKDLYWEEDSVQTRKIL